MSLAIRKKLKAVQQELAKTKEELFWANEKAEYGKKLARFLVEGHRAGIMQAYFLVTGRDIIEDSRAIHDKPKRKGVQP